MALACRGGEDEQKRYDWVIDGLWSCGVSTISRYYAVLVTVVYGLENQDGPKVVGRLSLVLGRPGDLPSATLLLDHDLTLGGPERSGLN